MKKCPNSLIGTKSGHVSMVICTQKGNQWYRKIVTKSICRKCQEGIPPETPQEARESDLTITPLGTLIYARTGWEPPPCPPGYRARSSDTESDDAWILDPDEPMCKHLTLSPADRGSCGYRRVAKRCGSIGAFVGARTCGTCPRRE
jgi:hypothetical protein